MMLTTKEAGAILGLTARSVARLIGNKQITAQRFGRDWMIEAAEVERYKRERKSVGRPRRSVGAQEGSEDGGATS
jgi:excisionase family DNA binding protein